MELKLTPQEQEALQKISEFEGRTLRDLLYLLGIGYDQAESVSQALSALAEQGWISEARIDLDDGTYRSRWYMSPAGRRMLRGQC